MLLSTEWLKLRRYRTFWIILGMFALMAPLGYYVLMLIINQEQAGMFLSRSNDFGSVWYNASYMAGYLLVVLGLLVIVLTGNEYQYRTNRQHVIDGWSRLNFYHAKWQLVLALSVAAMLFAMLYGFAAGLLQGAPLSGMGQGLINLVWVLLTAINYLGIALVLTLLIRRTGLAVIIYIAYYMMVDNILHSIFLLKLKKPVLDLLLPMECSDQLLPRPKGLERMLPSLDTYWYVIGTLAWIVLFYFIGRRKLLRSDW